MIDWKPEHVLMIAQQMMMPRKKPGVADLKQRLLRERKLPEVKKK